ncbi:jg8723 [Pararge aegeria aegeria]|uniref:Jg8723 protein n=1 Tax=Pararge aegeria aegeria TaxID=348720 RepID=A0A8S4S397_9NEOP|nr:jg8723 [Pararge aegeria aegeria]
MFYGVIIAFGALLYLVWKFLFAKGFQTSVIPAASAHDERELISKKDEANTNAKVSLFEAQPNPDRTGIDNTCNRLENLSLRRRSNSEQILKIKNVESEENKAYDPYLQFKRENKQNNFTKNTVPEVVEKYVIQSTQILQDKKFISPSLLLKQQNEKKQHEKLVKRISPPKERFAEFLENTILNDDKLQSIIQNLSLNECTVESTKVAEVLPAFSRIREESPFTEKAVELQKSIDQIADRVKRLNEINIDSDVLPENKKEDEAEEKECKSLFLRRLEKQTGLPTGLNFGSVIGELKLKTKNAGNGGLKPVFKKFDIDTVDSQESLNVAVDDKKKVLIDENELGSNILADRRNKLETAAQGWRKRVPQSDASLFTVAGRLERDKVTTATPPITPPPATTPPASSPVVTPAVPPPNRFRSRKAPTSPTNGFASGPLRSASCAVMSAVVDSKPKEAPKIDRESFKRSHSVSESISRVDQTEEISPGAEKSGCQVRVPRADDETFQAFFTPALQQEIILSTDVEVDLDAIDSGSRQLLASEWTRRAKRERRHVASRNPLRALAARTDLREEYLAQPLTIRDQLIKEKITANCGLAAEALAALASKEDFSNVALRSASATNIPSQGTKPLMMLHVKGRRRVQTRLVEPVHTNVNRGDCFLLVTSDQLFLYIGLYANVIERNRSTDIAQHILNTKDLGCKTSSGLIKIDEQTKNFSNKHWNQFWSLLGVTEEIENYNPAETGSPDEDEIFESCIVQTNMCYEVMDDELVPIKEYWGQLPKIAMLHQSKVIVFDYGSEMYIWYGKNVPLESRRRAAQLAQELFDEGYNYEECHINPLNAAAYQGAREESNTSTKSAKSRPEWAILSKVTQHMETILFKEKFLDWPDYSRVIKVKPQEYKSNSTEINPCDAEEMWSNEYHDPDLILEGSHVGRGTHYYDKESMRYYDIKTKSVCKWVIQEYDYQKVDNEEEIGEFFSGDSYIIRWEYQITVTGRELNGKPSKHNLTGRDRCAYFCWQGKDASSNEKGAAALLTVELDREKGPQVRVAQGNEPPAFLNLFQGKLVIHQGKRGTDKSRYKLFVTRGNIPNEAYMVQVPCSRTPAPSIGLICESKPSRVPPKRIQKNSFKSVLPFRRSVGAFAGRWQAMRAAALRTADAYWRVSRPTRPDVRVVAAGLEPHSFTALFDSWAEHDEAAEANIAHGYKSGEVVSGAVELSRLTSCDAVLPIAALQRRPLPDHVDPHHLERHLSEPDFLEAFGMTKEEFSVLPAWKQTNMKKDVGLF